MAVSRIDWRRGSGPSAAYALTKVSGNMVIEQYE